MSRLDREVSLDARPEPPRRGFRLRFREFLLLATLASVVAATVAVRLRTVREGSVAEHLFFYAPRARATAVELKARIERDKRRLDQWPDMTGGWLDGRDVAVWFGYDRSRSLGTTRRILSIGLGDWGYHSGSPRFWIGVYDEEGKLLFEHQGVSQSFHDAMYQIQERSGTRVELTGADKQSAIELVASMLDLDEFKLRLDLKTAQDELAHEIAEAERHEQQAGVR
jgi:hypothetical protein